ncbi:MAG TPA: DUF4382 domain-containing protein [Ohtaekwangia sp.]|uniref:DUF4382 domain-containing protein n=1 Tax=Ohtaekwangia sp. TaxID=2066019 RepID=UPI002F9531C2
MKRLVYLFLVAAWATGCSSDNSNAKLEVRLTDAPGDYEEVNIDIQEVEVHTAAGDQDSGWKTLDIKPGVYNILKLTNGLDTLLGTLELPAGRVSQVRLVLGDNNSVKIDGETKLLETPSAQQSGLKLNVQADLIEGVTYRLTLDFDAARSIVTKGNGGYSLKPVIRTLSEATSGAIKGVVNPAASTPAIYVVRTTVGDTIATAYTDATGRFLVRAVEPGSYTVKFSPKTGYEATERTGVTVSLGAVTDLGTINIP